ncbi:hypothetical protein Csp1_00620 [Corynebacterium provencense]|uniref:Uncharacterized protein n=2 Tax=Corynebacterium provencense TaxID=1737425 RepID=A0A2Z3YMQ2_9CORY|nr:hypothetical protein Csp1_00620 [Corynebacterium provencense]
MTELEGRLGDAVREGAEPGSPLADEHREVLSGFHALSVPVQVSLGRMHEDIAPGLTFWLRQAIDARARALGVDPDKAEWE